MKDGRGEARADSKGPGLNMLHPDFNFKLFKPVATLSGAEALRLTRITVANRPFHLNPPQGRQMSVIEMLRQPSLSFSRSADTVRI